MRRTAQKGSVEVALLVVLIVIVLAGLGWLLWKNMHADKTANDTAQPTSSQTASDDTKKTTEKCLTTEKLCFDVPKDWKMETTAVAANDGMPASEKATLYASAGKVRVLSIDSGIMGVGGACDPAAKSALTVSEAHKTSATSGDNPAKPVYAVKALYYDPAKGYIPFIFLSSSVTDAQTIPTCQPEISALYTSKHTDNGLVGAGNYIIGGADLEYLESKSDAESVLASQNYVDGFKLLESAHYN